jgi:protein subunit release factor A
MSEGALSERLDSLALDVSHAETIASASNVIDLADALVMVSLFDREGKAIGGVEQLATVFNEFAIRHRLSTEFLVEMFSETNDHACLSVSGLGASLLFKPEAGMHQMKRRFREAGSRNGREKTSEDSELIRVEVFPVTAEPDKKFVAAVSANVQELKPRRTRLITQAGWQVRLFHGASVMSLETCAGGTRAEALNRAMQVLHAQVSAASTGSVTEVVRRYDLGIGSKIKDNRTGRTTNQLAQFFKGRLELVRAIEA